MRPDRRRHGAASALRAAGLRVGARRRAAGGERGVLLAQRKDEALRHAAWELERPSWVLADSTGCWHVQPLDARPGYVRVWFCASVKLRARVPAFVQNLVSRLGLQRACGWVATLSNK